MDISSLDSYYKRYIKNISEWLPEGFVDIDLPLLKEFGLLQYHNEDLSHAPLTRYFHVLESNEKMTLVNEQFIVWIVPEKSEGDPRTTTLIALNEGKEPHLEVGFTAKGAYNSSRLVLRVLEKFLEEIQENEFLIGRYSQGKQN